MENAKNVRIKDIAKLAGVSIGTVDRVLHNRGKVSPTALSKINDALEKTGYKPNMLARSLSNKKTIRIATILPDPYLDEFWQHTNEGISTARKEWAQYNVEIKTFYYDLYNKDSFVTVSKQAIESKPNGILTSPIFHHEALDLFHEIDKSKIPFVFFNSNIPEIIPTCFIGQDYYQSGRLGAELLDLTTDTDAGTFAILHIFEDIHNSVHLTQKENGFIDYFNEKKDNKLNAIGVDFDHPVEPNLEQDLSSLLSNSDIKGFLVTTSKGLHLVATYLEKHRRGDITLVGYDLLEKNIHYLNKGIVHFLIHQNPKKQAVLGISNLVNLILFKKEIPNKDLFPLEIITKQNLKTYLG